MLMICLPKQAFYFYFGLQRDLCCLIHKRHLRPRDQKRQQRIRRRNRGRNAGDYPLRAWLCIRTIDLGSLVGAPRAEMAAHYLHAGWWHLYHWICDGQGYSDVDYMSLFRWHVWRGPAHRRAWRTGGYIRQHLSRRGNLAVRSDRFCWPV